MSSDTTGNTTEQWDRIRTYPVNLTGAIIARQWSNDLHSKLFATSSAVPSRISVIPPPSLANAIRTDPFDGNIKIRTTEPTESDVTSTTQAIFDNGTSARLGSKLAGDALVAAGVTFGVSPFLTVVDKAIVESTAGTSSILSSAANSIKSMARNPVEYFKSPTFLLMWAVYSATYTTANAFKTLEDHAKYSVDRSGSSSNSNKNAGMFKMAAFLGTTVVNSGASMLKDRAYAKMFSGSTSSSAIPKTTYALWMMRDLSVIGSSFLLPDLVSAKMVEYYNEEMDRERARSLCQIGLPVLAQFVAGPFQYLGLDVYNRNLSNLTTTQAIVDRSRQLSKGIAPVIAARIARIIPGYSIGGVANTKLRNAWREKLLERDVAAMMKNTDKSGNTGAATRMVALLHNNGDKKTRS
mmetsp:Transcript_7845/g.19216  ORF Transcript_7845/g.19216 Transcript_7845/m.19216 type:complete len:409 (+) Transcript_7845:68-1294(+)